MSSAVMEATTSDHAVHRRLSRRSISRPPPSGSEQSKLSDPLVMMRNLLNFPIEDEKAVSDREEISFSRIPLNNDEEFEKILNIDFNGIASLDTFVQSGEEGSIIFNIDEQLDFDTELKKYDNLHETINKSDEILENLEKYLTSFQIDLGSLSSEMQHLQNRSVELTKKLDGRRALENELSASINNLVLPPSIIRQIVNGEINSTWMKLVKYIKKRMILLGDESKATLLPEDTKNQIVLLSHKIVERARDFVIVRIKSLRTSQINSQSIQKNLLLYKDLYSYIKFAAPELSTDLREAYVNTMRWYYSSHFHRYVKSLEKLRLHHIDKGILLGSDDSSKRGLLSYGYSYSRAQPSSVTMMEYLNISKRASILDSDDSTVMLAKNAEENSSLQWMETGFRNFNLALLDNGCVEFQFISEFFEDNAHTEETKAIFNQIFASTFEIGHNYTKALSEDSLDAYGILICIRLSHKFLFELQHRIIPIMEDYFNYNLMIFWPKFQLIMDAHCESIKRASAKSSSYSVPKAGGPSGNSLGSISLVVVPHHLTQVFASFLTGLLILSNESSENEPLANSVVRLRNDFESFLTKVSASIFDNNRDKRAKEGSMREKFLFNNYSLIYTILADL
ncbi:Vps52/Sac2, partial [Nadsonia fulvescens var. elongata DSM 6958]